MRLTTAQPQQPAPAAAACSGGSEFGGGLLLETRVQLKRKIFTSERSGARLVHPSYYSFHSFPPCHFGCLLILCPSQFAPKPLGKL